MKTNMALTARSFLLRLALGLAGVLLLPQLCGAGGPKRVAGTTYFDPSVTGQPLIWPRGQIVYYTDQGDLSQFLPNASANSLVAGAFNAWTAVPTAAIAISNGGQLAEDVNGSNVISNADGSISLPVDIQPSATATPVGIVYDYDGAVTEALVGAGASDPAQCFSNAVFGGNDNYGTFATYQHGLIVINGRCAQQSSQLTDLQYRLQRTIGSVLGLGWSQLNPNVIVGNPHPTSDDYAGFPLMHSLDPTMCVPITKCYPNPLQISSDDAASLSRLYPVTAQNLSSFPGKQIFSASTARIHGSVFFTDRFGNRAQPMQGVNAVARWIDPSSGLPSRRYAVSSVSGFLFCGNAGNPVTGTDDSVGDALSDRGSESSTVQGFFDLAGLPLPSGTSAKYQLSVEAIDTNWDRGVGPYAPNEVAPSGTAQPIVVTVSAGGDVQQDILMLGSAQPVPPRWASDTWSAPAAIPSSGDWVGSLDSYDEISYFLLPAKANRTLSVAVTALDDFGAITNGKVRPVVGIWTASDAEGSPAPAFTPSPFNSTVFGETRLDAQIASAGNFLVGITDLRGDGRADFHYHAQVLYADSVSPPRVSVNGGVVSVTGMGLSPRVKATLGTAPAVPLSVSAAQVVLQLPAATDGPQNLTITDPATGGSSAMVGALTYGAAPDDNIVLVTGTNPATAVGMQATNPFAVHVVAADGVTPVSGATIGWLASNGLQLSACGGSASCTTTTDQSGAAATFLTPSATGNSVITATLAPGVYSPAKSVSAMLSASESASDIGVMTPYLWIAQGATVDMPVTARVVSNGTPQANATVNFTVVTGSGNLSAASAHTNASGYASVTLSLAQFASVVEVTACVAPSNAPCQNIYANPVPSSQLNLQTIAGSGQISAATSFQPVSLRVLDSSSPQHAVLGATVNFLSTILRPGASVPGTGDGENAPFNPAMPVILSVSQASAVSDANGLVTLTPSSGSFRPPLIVDVSVTAGSASLDLPLQMLPAWTGPTNSTLEKPPPERPWLVPVRQ